MVRPVVDDEELKVRLDAMVTKVEGECIDLPEIRNKSYEYHSANCPVFLNRRAAIRAQRMSVQQIPQVPR